MAARGACTAAGHAGDRVPRRYIADTFADRVRAFRQGLKDSGYVEGENVAIEYRRAEGQFERLPALAAELVRRKVAVMVATGGSTSAFAAKAATTTIPIVFGAGEDPVRLGLVASLNRPGGNLTGINFFSNELSAKRLELLRELVPAATLIAFIVNPNNPRTEFDVQDMEAAARALGQQIIVLNAGNDRDLEALFTILSERKVGALLVGNDPFLSSRPQQFALMAERHAVPAIYGLREHAVAGVW